MFRKLLLAFVFTLVASKAYSGLQLEGSTDSWELVTGSAGSIDYQVSWANVTATALTTPGTGKGNIASATTTTIVAAPAASNWRHIRHLTVRNVHASTSNTITIQLDVSATNRILFVVTLAASETLVFDGDGQTWTVYDSAGLAKVGGGGSTPTGTGFRHVTAGVEDAAAKLVDTADVNNDQITYGKIQDVVADDRLLGRVSGAGGNVEEIAATAPLGLSSGALVLTQNAGTDVTTDLEEETHGSEHQHGGADEIATATAAANAIPKAGAGSTLADGFIDGLTEADEVVGTETDESLCSWETTGTLVECDLAVNAGTALTADLEEETHATEHAAGAADPITATADRCARFNASGHLDAHTSDCAAGGGDSVTINGVAATDPDLRSEGGVVTTRCTGAAAPDSRCVAAEDVLFDPRTTTSFALGVVSDAPSASQNNYSPTGWDGTEPAKATMIRLAPTVTMQITGVAGGTSGRLLRLVNATDPAAADARLIILPHESASSTAANRFSFSHRAAWFVQPGDSITFSYDSTTSRWRPLERTALATLFDHWSEFNGGSSAELTNLVSGTGAACTVQTYLATSLTQNPGTAIRCHTGSTAVGRAGIMAGASGLVGVNPEESSAFHLSRIAVEALAVAAGDDFEVLSGFSDGGATQPLNTTDGVYWLYDVDASTVWRGCGEDAGVQDCATATGPTVNTNYIWLGIFLNGDWSRADFFYSTDGVAWTITTAITSDTNLPEGAESTAWIPVVIVKEAAGTAQRNVSIDLTGLTFNPIRGS